mgnify:FL=1
MLEEGSEVSLRGGLTDPGSEDWFRDFLWEVAFGGQRVASGSTQDFTFTPADDGTYLVTFTAQDKDGASSNVAQRELVVANVAPTTMILNAPAAVAEGTWISLSSAVTDAGVGDTFQNYAWSVTRDGQPVALDQRTVTNEPTFAFTPTGEGQYVVKLTVEDNGGLRSAPAEVTINVANIAPLVVIEGLPVGDVFEGDQLELSAKVSDPGVEQFAYRWTVTRDGQAFDLPGGREATSPCLR